MRVKFVGISQGQSKNTAVLGKWCPGTDQSAWSRLVQPKAGRSPTPWMWESIEPSTRGFSVDRVTDTLIESMS